MCSVTNNKMKTHQSDSNPTNEDDVVYRAADWQVRHDSGLSPQEKTDFAAWLAKDPCHRAAWADVNTTMTAMGNLQSQYAATAASIEYKMPQSTRRSRFGLIGATGIAAAIALFIGVWNYSSTPTELLSDASVIEKPKVNPAPLIAAKSAVLISRPRERILPDGSRVLFNERAKITVNYSNRSREVILLRGITYFEVQKNKDSPFIVKSGETQVRAVGTAFSVHGTPESVNVLVTEGSVSVASPTPANQVGSTMTETPEAILVNSNEQLIVPTKVSLSDAPKAHPLTASEIRKQLQWQRPRLVLTRTTLLDAVDALNRENEAQVTIATPKIEQMLLTGSFYADDVTNFVRLLENHYGVKVDRADQRKFVLSGE